MLEDERGSQFLAVRITWEVENRAFGLEWDLLCRWLLLNLIWDEKHGNVSQQ